MLAAWMQPTGLKTTKHIFVEEKGDYYEITDDLPQFAHSDTCTSRLILTSRIRGAIADVGTHFVTPGR